MLLQGSISMKKYEFNNISYELVENYKDAFEQEVVLEKMTDFFRVYDYIVGDWSYGKLRLKGFCNKKNKYYNNINDIKTKEKYLKDYCSYDCKYFVLKRIKEKKNKVN